MAAASGRLWCMKCSRLMGFWFVVLSAGMAAPAPAVAEAPAAEARVRWTGLGQLDDTLRHFGNFRIGTSSGYGEGRPEMCLELSPWQPIAVEACGNGSGFLHREDRPELAHFRARWRILQWTPRNLVVEPHLGAGFAELQIGEDAPGFSFGRVVGGVSTAGPEAMAALRLLVPLAGGFEMLADLGAGLAVLPAADELIVPQDVHHALAAFSLGIGF